MFSVPLIALEYFVRDANLVSACHLVVHAVCHVQIKWIAFASIITAGILSGVLLVALLLLLNLTVALGTLNGVIFYVNIVGANGGIFFLFSNQILSLFL